MGSQFIKEGRQMVTVESKPKYPDFMVDVLARLIAVEQKFEEKKVEHGTGFAKQKARLETAHEQQLELAKRKFVVEFLEVLDNLERAERLAIKNHDNVEIGLQLTASLFRKKLQGLEWCGWIC
jgi:molecular chaperone GrpE (heat shock protein)